MNLKHTLLFFFTILFLSSCVKTYTCVDIFGKTTGKVKSYTKAKADNICKQLGGTVAR
jgi:uncharacterized protein (UPF0333 family)